MPKRALHLPAGMFLAHNAIERRVGGRVSYAELGRLVAKAEGRPTPYSAGNVLRWGQGTKKPSLETLIALSELAGLPLDAVLYGEVPAAVPAISPIPSLPASAHRKLDVSTGTRAASGAGRTRRRGRG